MAIVTMLSTALSLSAGAATTKFLDTDNKYVYITNFSDQDKRLIEKKTAKDYTNSRYFSFFIVLVGFGPGSALRRAAPRSVDYFLTL